MDVDLVHKPNQYTAIQMLCLMHQQETLMELSSMVLQPFHSNLEEQTGLDLDVESAGRSPVLLTLEVTVELLLLLF